MLIIVLELDYVSLHVLHIQVSLEIGLMDLIDASVYVLQPHSLEIKQDLENAHTLALPFPLYIMLRMIQIDYVLKLARLEHMALQTYV
jgi:hypothetical protein